MTEPGMTAEGIYGLGHSTRRFAEDFFAIHFGVANHVLREDSVEFLPLPFFVELSHFNINLGHLYYIFAQGSLVEKCRRLAGVGTIDEVGIFVAAIQHERGCTFAEERTGLPVMNDDTSGEQ